MFICEWHTDFLYKHLCDQLGQAFSIKSFDLKYLGEANMILNIKMIKDESGITLTRSHYVAKVFSHFCFIDSKPSPTSYDPSVVL